MQDDLNILFAYLHLINIHEKTSYAIGSYELFQTVSDQHNWKIVDLQWLEHLRDHGNLF